MGNNSNSAQTKMEWRKLLNKEEMTQQWIVFGFTVLLTLLAFGVVLFQDDINPWFIAPFILLLAIVQVVFQLFYFMHMKSKGHEAPLLFIFSGALIAIVMIVALMTIVWV